jgi:hypothetical protein
VSNPALQVGKNNGFLRLEDLERFYPAPSRQETISSFFDFRSVFICFFEPQAALFRVMSGTNAVNSRETGNPQLKVTCFLLRNVRPR